MKKEKNAFLMAYDWYDTFQQCSDKEKAMILDYAYAINLNQKPPETSDRFMKSIFMQMDKFFSYSKEKYLETCIDKSLNQKLRWAKDKGNAGQIQKIKEQKNYLKFHSTQEYTRVYGSINDNINNDIDLDYEKEFEYDSDSDQDNEKDSDIDEEIDSEGMEEEGKEEGYNISAVNYVVSLPDLKTYCKENGFTFDVAKSFNVSKPFTTDQLEEWCIEQQSLHDKTHRH